MTAKKKQPAPSEIPGIVRTNGLQYLVTEMPRPTTVKTEGGLHLVTDESSKEEWARYGRVVVAGDGEIKHDGIHHPCKYEVGDCILMERFVAQTVVRDVHVRIVPERHIIAKVDPECIVADDDWRPGS